MGQVRSGGTPCTSGHSWKPGIIDDERDLAVADVPARVGHGGRGRCGGPVLRDGALRRWLWAQLVVIVGLSQQVGSVGGGLGGNSI